MNTRRRKNILSTTWLLAAAITLAAVPTGAANENRDKTQASAGNKPHRGFKNAAHATQNIKIAPDNIEQRTAETVTGKDVRGASGNVIGDVADVIVDCQSGKIAFFVVSRGGFAGIGDTLRLVPYGAIDRATNDDGFTVSVTEAQWDKMPAINEQDFEDGRINITADQQRQLAEDNDSSARVSNDGAENRGDFGQRLARAAKLRGLEVRANDREIGEIEDVVLDLDRGTATALMDADDDFAHAEGDYLVPLNNFQFTVDRDALTTTLAAADFSSATDRPMGANDGRRMPTDRDDNADPNRSLDPALQSAARSIRQIWDAHPDLAKLDLRVTPENGRLIFRGSVPNSQLWERAKDTAEGVVRAIEIENRISIGDQKR